MHTDNSTKQSAMKVCLVTYQRRLQQQEKLQEIYDITKFESVNEFLNAVLKSYAFKENRDDQIIELLDQIEDTTTAIWEKVKDVNSTTN